VRCCFVAADVSLKEVRVWAVKVEPLQQHCASKQGQQFTAYPQQCLQVE
jgi:hypothetical protein